MKSEVIDEPFLRNRVNVLQQGLSVHIVSNKSEGDRKSVASQVANFNKILGIAKLREADLFPVPLIVLNKACELLGKQTLDNHILDSFASLVLGAGKEKVARSLFEESRDFIQRLHGVPVSLSQDKGDKLTLLLGTVPHDDGL